MNELPIESHDFRNESIEHLASELADVVILTRDPFTAELWEAVAGVLAVDVGNAALSVIVQGDEDVVLDEVPRPPDYLRARTVRRLVWPSEFRNLREALGGRTTVPGQQEASQATEDLARVFWHCRLDDVDPGKRDELDVMFLRDLDALGTRKHIVDGLILDDSLTVLAGLPKSYKTTAADALSVAVADGSSWLGRAVRSPGTVLDFALEGALGKRARLQAAIGAQRWTDYSDPVHHRLALAQRLPNIATTAGQDEVLRLIEHLTQKSGEPLRLLKIDTLARGMAACGLDENSTVDMSAFIGGLDRIRSRFPCAHLVIHHVGKSGTLRGNSALAGAYDLLITAKAAGKFASEIHFPEARDIEPPPNCELSFASVVVGTDAEGRSVTAMRIARATFEGEGGATQVAQANEQAILDALCLAHDEGLTVAQLIDASGLPRTTVLDACKRLGSKLDKAPEARSSRYWLAGNRRASQVTGRSDGQANQPVTSSVRPSSGIVTEASDGPHTPCKGVGPHPSLPRAVSGGRHGQNQVTSQVTDEVTGNENDPSPNDRRTA